MENLRVRGPHQCNKSLKCFESVRPGTQGEGLASPAGTARGERDGYSCREGAGFAVRKKGQGSSVSVEVQRTGMPAPARREAPSEGKWEGGPQDGG